MNYVREELLRQAALLAALLGGGETESADRERENAAAGDMAAAEGREGAFTEKIHLTKKERRLGLPAAERQYGEQTKPGKGQRRETAWDDGDAAPGRALTGEDGGGLKSAEVQTSETAVSRWNGFNSDGRVKNRTAWMYTPDAAFAGSAGRAVQTAGALGTAADLRSVSRGFQRDARRYDGGFSIT